MMNKTQLEKYKRTIQLKDIGEKGQDTLLAKKVFIIGVGGLGNHVLTKLAALGVGCFGIADDDKVMLDNLPRQVLYDESDVGKLKVDVACYKIKRKNPDVEILKHSLRVDSTNIKELIEGYDLVIETSDNFDTKFIVEEGCKELGIDFIIAGVGGYEGQVMLCTKESKYTFRSLFDEVTFAVSDKYVEEDRSVYPLAVSMVADVACNLAVKYLLSKYKDVLNTVFTIESNSLEIRKFYFEI